MSYVHGKRLFNPLFHFQWRNNVIVSTNAEFQETEAEGGGAAVTLLPTLGNGDAVYRFDMCLFVNNSAAGECIDTLAKCSHWKYGRPGGATFNHQHCLLMSCM